MLYQLDAHVERLLRSAEMARIPLPSAPQRLREIILDTAAASGQLEGSVRYWLSAGPGGFGLGAGECVGSTFYVMVFGFEGYPESFYTEGVKVVSTPVPMKPPVFARIKSTNYLPNALVLLDAQERGADNGIFVDARGMVGESSNMNVAVVTGGGVLRHPPFDGVLAGITVLRILELAGVWWSRVFCGTSSWRISPWRRPEMRRRCCSSEARSKWSRWCSGDGQPVGKGRPGPIARSLLDLWLEDVRNASDQLVKVPYPEA